MTALAERQGWRDAVFTPKGLALGLVQGRLAPLGAGAGLDGFPCPVGLSPAEVLDALGRIKAAAGA